MLKYIYKVLIKDFSNLSIFYIITINICCFSNCFANDHTREIDSLLSLVEANKDCNIPKSIFFLEKAYKKSADLNIQEHIIKCLIYEGLLYYRFNKRKEALEAINRAIDISKISKNEIELARAYKVKSIIHSLGIFPEKAYTLLNNAIRLFTKNGEFKEVIETYLELGSLFSYHLVDFDLASRFINRAIQISKDHNMEIAILKSKLCLLDLKLISNKYSNIENDLNAMLPKVRKVNSLFLIAKFYKLYAKYHLDTKNFEKSIDYSLKSIGFFNQINNLVQVSILNTFIAYAYVSQKQYSKAIEYELLSLRIREKLGDPTFLASSHINLSYDYYLMENNDKAIELANKGLKIAKNQPNKLYITKTYQVLATIYSRMENKELALHYELLEKNLSYELDKVKSINKIKTKEYANRIKLKNAQLSYIREKSKFDLYLFISILIFISLIFIFTIIHFFQKNSANKLLKEKIKIIEQKNTELADTVEQRDQLFFVIGHELLNPIVWLKNTTSNLIEEKNNYIDKKTFDTIYAINSSCETLYQSADNLVNWGKSHKISFTPELVEICSFLEKTVKQLIYIAENKKIALQMNFDEPIFLCIDASMIELVIKNLIQNAIKFSHEGGCIEIGVSSNGLDALVFVKDTGIGIPQEMISRIFENGNSSDGTSQEKGSGFGLFLCKEFIEKHDGRIWIESEYGVGSIFMFTVPLLRI